MPTRLLTRKEIKKAESTQLDSELVRASRIREFVTEETKKLNEYKAKKLEEIQKIDSRLENTTERYLTEVEVLKNEVSALERRRDHARRDYDAYILREKDISEEGKRALVEALNKETELAEEKARLIAWQDEIQDLNDQISNRNAELIEKERAYETQKNFLSEAHKSFNDKVMRIESELADRNKKLLSEEAENSAQKELFKAEREQLDLLRKELEQEKLKIKSDRDTLANAFYEARKKGII